MKLDKVANSQNDEFYTPVYAISPIESQERFEMFRNNTFEIMYLNRRVAYFKDYDEQKPSLHPPFSSVYVCHHILPERIVFEEIKKCG